ncbi:hypothetical protein B0H15DRAFT_175652 [Mycena belliarum]|uniref:Uncharacterized protein n=1 Tax=Mycena belliarum TaxID=1033014 RepID=A0AAD6XWE0_9AGAR|nr:hypothetical protein B0H15DRAFT_175652 [Mycena belliae]
MLLEICEHLRLISNPCVVFQHEHKGNNGTAGVKPTHCHPSAQSRPRPFPSPLRVLPPPPHVASGWARRGGSILLECKLAMPGEASLGPRCAGQARAGARSGARASFRDIISSCHWAQLIMSLGSLSGYGADIGEAAYTRHHFADRVGKQRIGTANMSGKKDDDNEKTRTGSTGSSRWDLSLRAEEESRSRACRQVLASVLSICDSYPTRCIVPARGLTS